MVAERGRVRGWAEIDATAVAERSQLEGVVQLADVFPWRGRKFLGYEGEEKRSV